MQLSYTIRNVAIFGCIQVIIITYSILAVNILLKGIYAEEYSIPTFALMFCDQAFDREFALGFEGFADPPRQVPIERIHQMNVRDLMDPQNKFPEKGLFRYRSRGIAVAPFVIVDNAAVVWASMGGFGGLRLNFWFFGLGKWWLLRAYWHV